MATTTNLDSLVINYLTQEQYDEAQQAGTLNANQLYLTPDTGNTYGTVTSVGITNATNGGLSISGSPVTSSGSITVGHSNVLSSAQTTQAVYPIKIDKNGHISAYGSAVTISDEKVKQENTTSSSAYRVLLSGSANDTTSTSTSYKSTKLRFTPSTGELDVTGKVGSKGFSSYYTGNTGVSHISHTSNSIELYSDSDLYGSATLLVESGSLKLSRKPAGSSSTEIDYINIPGNSETIGITVTGLKTPTSDADAATKKYVDDSIGAIPAATDEKVKQTEKNDNYTKTILLGSNTTSDVTSGVEKTANLRYNDNGSIELLVGPLSGNYAAYQSTGIIFNKPYVYELEIPTGLTSNKKITFPSTTGTIALTSDIPSVYSSTNTGGYLTMATLPIYNGTVV